MKKLITTNLTLFLFLQHNPAKIKPLKKQLIKQKIKKKYQ